MYPLFSPKTHFAHLRTDVHFFCCKISGEARGVACSSKSKVPASTPGPWNNTPCGIIADLQDRMPCR